MKNIAPLFFISLAVILSACTLPGQKPAPTACTMEAKICPDGSSVGREGPNCEFAQCQNAGNTGLANPASVNCQEKGGTLEIITDLEGNQSGLCKFPDDTQCEEWAFFRGECRPGLITSSSTTTITTIADWSVYQSQEYGLEFQYPKNWPKPEISAGVYTGGYPQVRSNWRINVGPVSRGACEGEDCYGLYFDKFSVQNYAETLKALKNDGSINGITEEVINGNNVIFFTEAGMKDYASALIFGSAMMIKLQDSGLSSSAGNFRQIISTIKFIK
ncbi:MAG: DUF333 domain-containing protein [Patescibacteria group bacterium]|jgi:putative hemolysin